MKFVSLVQGLLLAITHSAYTQKSLRPTTLGYYKFHSELVTWDRARVVCQTEGAHLAIINSEEEARLFKVMFDRFPRNFWSHAKPSVEFVWLGFHDLIREGEHVTVFDESLHSTGFERWQSPTEPSNDVKPDVTSDPGQDCGAMDRATSGLADEACYDIAPFICEQ